VTFLAQHWHVAIPGLVIFFVAWGGTDDLMQINPYVTASVGAKVWKWA